MIRAFKMMNGHEIFAELGTDKEGEESELIWHYPLVLSRIPNPKNPQEIGIRFSPWTSITDDSIKKVVLRNDNAILFCVEPDPKVEEHYKSTVEALRMRLSGMIPPDKPQHRNLIL